MAGLLRDVFFPGLCVASAQTRDRVQPNSHEFVWDSRNDVVVVHRRIEGLWTGRPVVSHLSGLRTFPSSFEVTPDTILTVQRGTARSAPSHPHKTVHQPLTSDMSMYFVALCFLGAALFLLLEKWWSASCCVTLQPHPTICERSFFYHLFKKQLSITHPFKPSQSHFTHTNNLLSRSNPPSREHWFRHAHTRTSPFSSAYG